MKKILDHARVYENTLKISVENIEDLSVLIEDVKTKSKELDDAVDRLNQFKLDISFSLSGD